MTAGAVLLLPPVAAAAGLWLAPRGWAVAICRGAYGLVLALAIALGVVDGAGHGLSMLAAMLLGIDGLAGPVTGHEPVVRRTGRMAALAGMLAAAVAADGQDNALAWCAMVLGVAGLAWAKRLPSAPRPRDDADILAGAGLLLALYGAVAPATPLSGGCLVLGLAALAALYPVLAIPALVILFRVPPSATALFPALGLGGALACAGAPWLRAGLRPRPDWLFLGHASLAVMLLGPGLDQGRLAALVLLVLTVLARGAAMQPVGDDTAVHAAARLGLAGIQPAGVLPALCMAATVLATSRPWLLAPAGAAVLGMAAGALARQPARRVRSSHPSAAAWALLALALFIGWFLPAEGTAWLRAISGDR